MLFDIGIRMPLYIIDELITCIATVISIGYQITKMWYDEEGNYDYATHKTKIPGKAVGKIYFL